MVPHLHRATLVGQSDVRPMDTGSSAGTMRTVYLETFGCQMSELERELVRGHLESLGYQFTEDPASASILLYNTCSVREQAENKAFSRIGLAGVRKRGAQRAHVVAASLWLGTRDV